MSHLRESARRVHRDAPDATVETVHRVSKPLMQLSLVCVAVLTVSVSAQISDRICQELPLWLQRNAARITWTFLILLFAYLSSFGSRFAYLTRHVKRRRLTLALVLLNVSFLIFNLQLNTLVAEKLEHKTSDDGIILQSSGSSCAAATVANILVHFEIPAIEADVARVMGTTFLGSSPGQMRYSLEFYGLEFETLNERTPDLARVHPPAILFVDHPAVGSEGHAVAYFGVRGEKFEIWDPLTGKGLWNEDHVKRRWHGNGIECRAR